MILVGLSWHWHQRTKAGARALLELHTLTRSLSLPPDATAVQRGGCQWAKTGTMALLAPRSLSLSLSLSLEPWLRP